jgi:hypothetical protein
VLLWITLVLAGIAAETAAAAPRLLCYPVMPGDTITALSVRLTQNPSSWRGDGFQILDPAAARFLHKTEYQQIHPGLQACVVEPMVALSAAPGGDFWLLILVCSAAATVYFALLSSIDRRKAASRALQAFGAAFVREFERPLIDERSPHAVLRSELALSRDGRSLEVLLAPTDGRRYPNLADHRTNVEYDVERVLSFLNDRRFTCGPLRTRGSWVAIPLQLTSDVRKEGGA